MVGSIVDITSLGVMGVSLIKGMNTGISKTISKIAGTSVGIYGAYLSTGKVKSYLYNSIEMKEKLNTLFKVTFDKSDNALEAVSSLSYFDNFLNTSKNLASSVLARALTTVVEPLVSVVFKILVFVALLLTIKLLVQGLIGFFNRSPALEQGSNKQIFLGSILGLGEGAIWSFLLGASVYWVSKVLFNGTVIFSNLLNESSILSMLHIIFEG